MSGADSPFEQGWLEFAESIEFSADPRAVWRVTGDFGALARWMPGITATRVSGRGVGANRILQMGEAEMAETLLLLDDARMVLTYRMDKGPLRVRAYTSTLRVSATNAGARVEWSARCRPDGIAPGRLEQGLRRSYRAGLLSLAALFVTHRELPDTGPWHNAVSRTD